MYTCRFILLYRHKENRRSLKKVFLEKRTSSTRSYFPRSWYISRTIRSLVQNTWIGFQTQEPHMTSRLYNWKYRSIHVLGYQIHEKLCTFHGNRSWILFSPIYYWLFSPQNVFVYVQLVCFWSGCFLNIPIGATVSLIGLSTTGFYPFIRRFNPYHYCTLYRMVVRVSLSPWAWPCCSLFLCFCSLAWHRSFPLRPPSCVPSCLRRSSFFWDSIWVSSRNSSCKNSSSHDSCFPFAPFPILLTWIGWQTPVVWGLGYLGFESLRARVFRPLSVVVCATGAQPGPNTAHPTVHSSRSNNLIVCPFVRPLCHPRYLSLKAARNNGLVDSFRFVIVLSVPA